MIKDLIEKVNSKCTKKKESDGSYGDLGVIPSAPSNLGKDKNKDKEHMIVDGDIQENMNEGDYTGLLDIDFYADFYTLIGGVVGPSSKLDPMQKKLEKINVKKQTEDMGGSEDQFVYVTKTQINMYPDLYALSFTVYFASSDEGALFKEVSKICGKSVYIDSEKA